MTDGSLSESCGFLQLKELACHCRYNHLPRNILSIHGSIGSTVRVMCYVGKTLKKSLKCVFKHPYVGSYVGLQLESGSTNGDQCTRQRASQSTNPLVTGIVRV